MDEFFASLSLFTFATLILVWFLSSRVFKPHRNEGLRLPPSPPRIPVLGNLHQLSVLTHRSLHSLGTKYGPIMLLHFGSRTVIIVQSAAAAREILKTNDLIFADKPNSRTTRRLFYDSKDISTAPYGEYWRRMKSMCILQLLTGKRVQSFDFIREEEMELFLKKIAECSLCRSPVNLSELFEMLTNNVICRAAFGRKYGEGNDGRKFLSLLREILLLMGSTNVGEFIPWLRWIDHVRGFNRRVDKVAEEVDEFLEMVIQEHMYPPGAAAEVENGDNFVGILLEIYKGNNTTAGVSIDRDGVKAILLNMLAGGTDTTTATLEWTMTELLRHPNVMNTLQCEVRAILKDSNQGITNGDLDKMKYLKSVVKEVMRLHPPIPFLAREARQDVKVMGYDIAFGTMIIINTWATGRDPSSWDGPETFKPERFLNGSIDFRGLDFELIPFGAGRRGCPGIGFGMASIELALANLVRKFDWDLPEGTKLEGLDDTELPGIVIHRKNPLFAIPSECRLNKN